MQLVVPAQGQLGRHDHGHDVGLLAARVWQLPVAYFQVVGRMAAVLRDLPAEGLLHALRRLGQSLLGQPHRKELHVGRR
jgi:hypothetical protein